jgi:hypothetical protein
VLRFFLPFGSFAGQAGATAVTSIPTIVKVGSMSMARLSYMMLEDAENSGLQIEFKEERVDATFGFFATINFAATMWTANQLTRIQPQWAVQSLELAREAKLLDNAGDVTQAQIKRREAREAAKRAGSRIGRGIGKVFLIDSLIWAGTGGIDLALNVLGIPEEDQGVFADVYGGWSPLGYVLEQVIGLIFDVFGIEIEDLWAELAELVAESPTFEAAILAAMRFYIERIGGEINIGSYELSKAMNESVFSAWVDMIDEDPLSVIMTFAESVIVLLMLGVVVSTTINVIKRAMSG